MIEIYLLLTACVILGSMAVSYRRTRDPLSPLITFTPMLLYVYAFHPFVIHSNPQFISFFPHPEDREFVFIVNLISVAAFCAGASYFRHSSSDNQSFQILDLDASMRVRRNFFQLSLVLGVMASLSFWWMVYQSGGPLKLLRQNKPFMVSASGYIGEMPMLTYPAVLLLAAAWQGRQLNLGRVLMALLIASPQLSWAIIGKRRGTIFLIGATLAAFWYLVRNKKPNWKMIVGGVGMLGLLLLFVAAHRSQGLLEALGADSQSNLTDTLAGSRLTAGDEFVSSSATILASRHNNHHYWGLRFFAMFVVRPIPSFLWESKWDDLGVGFMKSQAGQAGMTETQWDLAVGFNPLMGSAGGFVSDAYLEWAWGGPVACFVLGFGFSWLWKQWVTHGGVWTVIYVEAMILTVYLPSQSLGAWAYRFALIAVPTAFVFWLFAPNRRRKRSRLPPPPIPVQTF